MSVETDIVPPVPEHTPPLQEDNGKNHPGKSFNHVWTRWFVSLREKINVINDQLTTLSQLIGGGFIVVDGNTVAQRTIQGTSGRISVTNGDGIAGDPTIDFVNVGTAGTYGGAILGLNISTDASGRVTATSVSNTTSTSTATGGSATALPAQPVGYITVQVMLSGVPTDVKIPYYT